MATTSFFTKMLVGRLEADGASVPDSILTLLDKPFDAFTQEENRQYQDQMQGHQLDKVFCRLLRTI
ncbi:MAG: hypothetical protein SWK76_07500 [Actinomycetota bacterium]|nr:hypothetical protein [Actinomycetota bacterium]